MHVLKEPTAPSLMRPEYFDPRLERVILKAMHKERAKRPQSMRELRGLLRELLVPKIAQASGALGPESSRGPLSVRPQSVRDVLASDPDGMIEALISTNDPKRFPALIAGLENAMMTVTRRSEVTQLAKMVDALDQIANGAAPGDRTREELAARALRTLADAALLTPIADVALASTMDQVRDIAAALVLREGGVGAHALCAARERRRSEPVERVRWVAIMRTIGAAAWPALLGALQRLESARGVAVDVAFAEDVLRSIPNVRDEAAGKLVSRFVRHPSVLVARAAIDALVSLWDARARPLLIGVLDNADDVVRIAALGALRRDGWVDEHVVRRVDRMLSRAAPASDELRAAAAVALGDCGPATLAMATASLVLVLAGPIEERAACSEDPLRAQLRALRLGMRAT